LNGPASQRRYRRSRRPGVLANLAGWAALAVLGVVAVCGLMLNQSPSEAVTYWEAKLGLRHLLVADGGAPFAFESFGSGSNQPTRWPACTSIRYLTNLRHAPPSAGPVLDESLATVHALTGLNFVDVGSTSATDFTNYDSTSGDLPPVVFAWLDPSQLLGQTQVNAVTQPYIADLSAQFYGGGVVLFNDAENADFARHRAFAHNLVLHEVGHLVGLANVNDPNEVMNESLGPDTTISGYGSGDRDGLLALYPRSC